MKAYDHEVEESVDWSEGTGTYNVVLQLKVKPEFIEYHIILRGEIEVKSDYWEGDYDTAPCGEAEVIDTIVSSVDIYVDEKMIPQFNTPITEDFLKAQLTEHCT